MLLTGGAEQSRDLPVPGRDLDGIHFAMEFLPQQNKVNAGDKVKGQIRADGKHVIVIGGGDTGSRLRGHQQPPRRRQRHAVRADAAAARGREQAADLALLAVQAAHQSPATKKAASASSPSPPRNSSARRARSPA